MSSTEPPGSEPGAPSPSRRRFLTGLSVGLGGAGAALVAVPFIGFLLGPLLRKAPERWFSVGPVSAFPVGETVQVAFTDTSSVPWAGLAANTSAWLRRETPTEFTAFSVNCTHLGCPIRWLAGASLFMCPCHGGVFYQDGRVAGGPPQRPLVRYPVRIRDDMVELQDLTYQPGNPAE